MFNVKSLFSSSMQEAMNSYDSKVEDDMFDPCSIQHGFPKPNFARVACTSAMSRYGTTQMTTRTALKRRRLVVTLLFGVGSIQAVMLASGVQDCDVETA